MKRIEKLTSNGAAYRLSGLIECMDERKLSDAEVEAIKALKSDPVIIGGRPLGVYALATLDITGAEKYKGQDENVIDFIRAF